MKNYELESNEVILYEDIVTCSGCRGNLELILTSLKLVLKKEKGILRKEKELIDTVNLANIKIYNDKVQVSQKRSKVHIQAIDKNLEITFNSIFKANKFVMKTVEACTCTSITERSTEKIKGAINTVNDVLGIDTRDVLKGVVENGITGTLLKGLKKGSNTKK